MASREVLQDWVIEALNAYNGAATIVEVSKHIWEHHEGELRSSENLFYTWQYDVRWAAQKLRNSGMMKPIHGSKSSLWELA